MIFTPGNIITFVICLFLLILFRHFDKNNRSIEKVKKFGDKLKDDLDVFIKERTLHLEESSLSLDVEQQRAIAAVKRLESIREDLVKREEELSGRTSTVNDMGSQLQTYEATMKQLLNMTAIAETNLSRITSESDFADSLGKKILATRKQIEEISVAIPLLREDFARSNRETLEAIHADSIATIGESISKLEQKVSLAQKESNETLSTAAEKIKDLYQKAFSESAKRADSLEESSFQKLKEQAMERFSRYKANIEEKSAALNDMAKEKIQETQQLLKTFKTEWKTEASDFLEATRAEIRDLSAHADTNIASIEERIRSAEALSESRADKILAEIHQYNSNFESELAALSEKSSMSIAELDSNITGRISEITETSQKSAEHITEEISLLDSSLNANVLRLESAFKNSLTMTVEGLKKDLSALSEKSTASLAEFDSIVEKRLMESNENSKKTADTISAEIVRLDSLLESSVANLDSTFKTNLAHTVELINKELALISEKSLTSLEGLDSSISNRISETKERTQKTAEEIASEISRLDSTFKANIARTVETVDSEIEKEMNRVEGKFIAATQGVEDKITFLGSDIHSRLDQYSKNILDVERLDTELRKTMLDTENRIVSDFSGFVQEQSSEQKAFQQKLFEQGDIVSNRMQSLEKELNELKSRAYDNVSEKLKVFEDDFFEDLATRGEAITAALDNWKVNVDARLDALTADSESSRADVEAVYALQLKERLSAINEQYRSQTDRLEEMIVSVETNLRSRITASDQSLLTFIEQYRSEFAHAKETAAQHAQNELDEHAATVQEALRKQEREIDIRTKEFVLFMDNSKTDAETVLGTIRNDFAAWQSRNESQLASAKSLLDDRLSALDTSVTSSIANLESTWQSYYKDFVAKTDDEKKMIKAELLELKTEIAESSEAFEKQTAEALKEFTEKWQSMTIDTERKLRETGVETDQTLRSLKVMVQEIRETVDQNREKLFGKVQADTLSLSQTLEDIDKKQKGFIAQTKIFERADQLKNALEMDIENLKAEVSRLDVYRESMNTLEQQYNKIRKLEEEATQKVSKFMAEKKRIDILETDFSHLIGLSDSVDKKIAELTLANDDLQQYQVQLRRFEESITDVNGRYERLEKKAGVLDQTVTGVDRAFETLKEFENLLQDYRKSMSEMPSELAGLRRDIDSLLENSDKVSLSVEKLDVLDSVLIDLETRTEKLQTAREWIARTETRLEEISKQSQDQLKLLGDLLKEDGSAKKTKGAPPIGIRENVVKLAHQGWKVDEISRALHLSRGEVELILELPQK